MKKAIDKELKSDEVSHHFSTFDKILASTFLHAILFYISYSNILYVIHICGCSLVVKQEPSSSGREFDSLHPLQILLKVFL